MPELTTQQFNELMRSKSKGDRARSLRPANQHEPQTEAKAKARKARKRKRK